jgi:ferredoxin
MFAESAASQTPEGKGAGMKVTVDYTQCMGDRNCNKVCPEVFAYDEEKFYSRVQFDVVPSHLEAKALQAAEECPVKAIIVEA